MTPDRILILAQFVTFLTVLAGFGFQWVREGRRRRWEIEDRDAVAARLVVANTLIAQTVVKQNGDIAKALATHTANATERLADLIQTVIDVQQEKAQPRG